MSVGGVISRFAKHGLSLAVMVGGLPLVASVGLALRGENWRDADSGPFLAVLVPALVIVLLVAAAFGDAIDVPWPIERYIIYLAPLTFIALMLVPGRVSWRLGLGLSVALGLALLGLPKAQQAVEQAALFGATLRVKSIGESFGRHPAIWVALVWTAVGRRRHVVPDAPPRLRADRRTRAPRGSLACCCSWSPSRPGTTSCAGSTSERRVLPAQLDFVERQTDKRGRTRQRGSDVHVQHPRQAAAGRRRSSRSSFSTATSRTSTTRATRTPAGSRFASARTGSPPTARRPRRVPNCPPVPANLLVLGGVFASTFRDEQVLTTVPRQGWRLLEMPTPSPRVLGDRALALQRGDLHGRPAREHLARPARRGDRRASPRSATARRRSPTASPQGTRVVTLAPRSTAHDPRPRHARPAGGADARERVRHVPGRPGPRARGLEGHPDLLEQVGDLRTAPELDALERGRAGGGRPVQLDREDAAAPARPGCGSSSPGWA